MSNPIGQVLLNQFRVESFVAAGGMGAVYRVWDLKRNVSLAMKVLHAELAEDPSIYKRFRREATALRKLAHPNIVPFYGLHRTSEFAFLLEHFIEGPTLKQVLQRQRGNPITSEEALPYMKTLTSALGFAHSHDVVHCDVKPGNVMIDHGGTIYLTDFGIARHAESSVTTLGFAGTAAYMAPEQCRAEPVSAETDIYALGVVLYEMLTGRRPFKGDEKETRGTGSTGAERIRHAHIHLPPPDPRTFNPSIPRELAEVILKALNKRPSDRYRTSIEFFEEVSSALGISPEKISDRVKLKPELFQVPQPVGPLPSDKLRPDDLQAKPQKPINISVIVGIVIIVGGFLIYQLINAGSATIPLMERPTSGEVVGKPAEQPSKTPFLEDDSEVQDSGTPERVTSTSIPIPTITSIPTSVPTHTSIPVSIPTYTSIPSVKNEFDLAFVSDRGGTHNIHLINTNDLSDWMELPLPAGYERAWWPTFCGDTIYAEVQDIHGTYNQQIARIDPAERRVTLWYSPRAENELGVPRCSSDGRYLAYSSKQGREWKLTIVDLFNNDEIFVINNVSDVSITGYTSWPSFNEVFLSMAYHSSSRIYKIWQTNSLNPDRTDDITPARMSTNASIEHGKFPAISPDGEELAFICQHGDDRYLCVTDLGSSEAERLYLINYAFVDGQEMPGGTPMWSADGKWIYYASADDGDWDIYRVRPDGRNKQNLTSNWGSHEFMPAAVR